MDARDFFTDEQIARARRYHRPLYAAFFAGAAIDLGALSVLAFAWNPAGAVGGPWWARTLATAGVALGALAVARLPLSFWRGYVHEKRWRFSTQTAAGWAADAAKALAVSLLLGSVTAFAVVGTARASPSAWPAIVAAEAATLALLLSFVAPIVLEPLFLRFRPLSDEEAAEELRELSRRAGVPVRDVLVADASRRTRKSNAYVSGLGLTRRVVVFDTLLEDGDRPGLRLVVAHELAHRARRHVLKGTALAVLGSIVFVLVFWGVASDPGDPATVPLLLLVGSALELAGLPLAAAISRRFEHEADRGSLELTGDADAYERAHRALALRNLSDLDPPRLLYLALFSHPTAPQRLALARAWKD